MNLRNTLFIIFCSVAGNALADLPVDAPGKVETLPATYPQHWVWAQDVAFGHMMDGKMILLNADGDTVMEQFKGMVNAAFVSVFVAAKSRPELYIAETFYSRINRGVRTDVISVYDKATLSPIAEIDLPGNKRAGSLPGKYSLSFTNDEKFLLVYNFTPATSITVVDAVNRKVLNEISLPSCALSYPTGTNGFSALCSNASMISIALDDKGQVNNRAVIKPFFDIDEDALSEKPMIIDGTAYFTTFRANMQEVDLSGSEARLGKRWSLVSAAEKKDNWRPGGIQFTAKDTKGNMYIIMHVDGQEGTHDNPGTEVWVYDVKKRMRTRRVELKQLGLSVELSRDDKPLLMVVNVEFHIDVYEADTGNYLRTISQFGQETPLLLHAAK